MTHGSRYVATTLAAVLAVAGCGGSPAPPREPPPPENTVFGELVEQKQALPAAVDAAHQQRREATDQAIDAAAGGVDAQQ